MDIYDRLGVKRVINAQGHASKVGGSLMSDPVLDAMRQAARSYVDIAELLARAGEHLARLIGVEAVLVVNSAAAGLAVATAACVAGRDPAKITRLPDTAGMKNEIVVHRFHRNHYDGCVRQVGIAFREIGLAGDTAAWELEKAITDKAAAVLYFVAYEGRNTLPLSSVIDIAHQAGVPVIVDAASEIPPLDNLAGIAAAGADLVIISGGKGLGGPQTSGLILGGRDLVGCCALNSFPNQNTIGRAMKVGKEEIAGLVVAVEQTLAEGFGKKRLVWEERVETMLGFLRNLPHAEIRSVIDMPEEHDLHPVPIPRVWVDVRDGGRRNDVLRLLGRGSPGISVRAIGRTVFTLAPEPLQDGEARIVAERVRDALIETAPA